MNTSRFSAGARSFAHLAGFSRKPLAAAADDQRDDGQDVDDEDEPKGKRSRASDDDDDQPQGKKSKRAADDDDDQDEPKGKKSKASDDDDDDEEPKGKKSRRAADDEDDEEAEDDDDEKEMHGRSANASARRREQARISHILGSKHAAHNLPLAVSLACETRMPRREAVAVLKGQAGNASPSRDEDDGGNRHARSDRSSRNVRLGGGTPAPDGKQAVAASWGNAFAKAGVKTR